MAQQANSGRRTSLDDKKQRAAGRGSRATERDSHPAGGAFGGRAGDRALRASSHLDVGASKRSGRKR